MRLGLKETLILAVFAFGLALADARSWSSGGRCATCELDLALRMSLDDQTSHRNRNNNSSDRPSGLPLQSHASSIGDNQPKPIPADGPIRLR